MSLQKIGTVVSDKMEKTVVVEVVTKKPHPVYRKIVKYVARFKADNLLRAKLGDVVKIVETRPISKGKNWRVLEVVKSVTTPKHS